jgi:adenosylcobinamide-GDP ribazoletransferase
MLTLWIKALATACIFLTRLPLPAISKIEPEDEGRALLCFPAVGLIIGLLLLVISLAANGLLNPIVTAAILLAFWAAITGGLHLDGLADSADGWLGGVDDKERTLEIMQDPRCGSAAVVAVGCLLIIKFAALFVILQQQQLMALLIAPIIGRCIASLIFVEGTIFYTPYVQPKGIAQNFISHCPSIAPILAVAAIFICGLLLGNITQALWMIICVGIMLWLLRKLMLKNLGGATGDTVGASTEIIESCVLIVLGIAVA